MYSPFFVFRSRKRSRIFLLSVCIANLLIADVRTTDLKQATDESELTESTADEPIASASLNEESSRGDPVSTTEKNHRTHNTEAAELFDAAMSVLSSSRSRVHRQNAINKLEQSAELGNMEAVAQLGFIALFGEDELHVKYNLRNWRDATRWQNTTLAFELFDRAAQHGVAAGQLGLAFMYSVGLAPTGASQSRAIVYLTFAALGGDADAQTALGYRYWVGANVEQSCETALTYYSSAAARVAERVSLIGSPNQATGVQRVRLVDEYETVGLTTSSAVTAGGSSTPTTIDEELIEYHLFLAEKGDVTAQVALGQLYYFGGRGLEQDFEKAAHYFERAAEQDNALASAHLAKMYLEGSAAKQDNATAYSLFQRAANKGHPFGHAGVGLMHLLGVGVPQDFGKALKNLNLAVDQGWADGHLQLGLMYYQGLGVRRDVKQAIKLFTAAAQSGNLLAIYNLAQLHAHGANGLTRNCRTAAELFKNVAERGLSNSLFEHAFAAYRFGAPSNDAALVRYLFLSELGYELAQSNAAFILERAETDLFRSTSEESSDLESPVEDHFDNTTRGPLYRLANTYWYRSALQGSGVARLKLGDYHYYGLGIESDYEQAAAQYQIAADQFHIAQAMFNLGLMHHFGIGMKVDEHLAKRYYDQAAETSSDAALPAAFALARLNAWLIFESFTSGWRLVLSPTEFFASLRGLVTMPRLRQMLGKDWDWYAFLLLFVTICLLIVARRFTQLQQQHAQLHARVPVAPAPQAPAPAPAAREEAAAQQ